MHMLSLTNCSNVPVKAKLLNCTVADAKCGSYIHTTRWQKYCLLHEAKKLIRFFPDRVVSIK